MRKITILCFLLLISFIGNAQVKLRRICVGASGDITVMWYPYSDTCTAVDKIVVYAAKNTGAAFNAVDSLTSGDYSEYVHKGAKAVYGAGGFYFIKYVLNCGSTKIVFSDTLEVDITEPSPITPDSVSVINGKAVLGWTPVGAPDTKGYLLFKVENQGSTVINQVVDSIYGRNSSEYIDTNISDNPNVSSQSYKLNVFDSCINISPFDNEVKTILLGLSQDTCQHEIFLSWTGYEGWPVDSYAVFLYNSSSLPLTGMRRVGSVSGTQNAFTYQAGISANRNYYFMVRAYKQGLPYSSSSSNVAIIKSLFSGAAGYIYIRKVTVADGKVKIVWTVEYPQALTYFEILSGSSKTYMTPIGKVNINNSTTYSFDDNNADPDKDVRYYQVQAYDICGAASGLSNISNNIVLKAFDIPKGRALSWNKYGTWNAGMGRYYISRSITDSNLVSFDTLGSTDSTIFQYSDFSVIDTTSDLGFCYVLQAVEGKGDTLGFMDTIYSNISCIVEAPIIYFPNALIRQGINKAFQPTFLYVDFSHSSYQIYDRWGNMVSSENDVRKGWVAMENGQHIEAGVYFYYYKITGLDKKEYYYKGTISVL